jgi:HK97 family phage portal protein
VNKLPFFQNFVDKYIWSVSPILHTKAQVLTPEAWANEVANSLDNTTEEAITIPAVLRAFQLLSETVASLPIHIHEKEKNGDRKLNTTHKLNKLLGSEPNKHMSSFLWRKVLITDMLMFGNGISRIVRNSMGDIVALRTLDADSTEIKYNKEEDTYYFDYKETTGYPEESNIYEEDEVLNFPWFTRDGVNGLAPIELAAKALGVSLNQQDNQLNMSANDSRPPGLLVNQGATSDQAKQAKDAWQNAQTGKGKGKTAVLSGGWDYKQLTIPNDQLQFIQQREFSVTEIARIFGVPPHLLADLTRATFSNIEHQGIEFVSYTLMGLLRNIETELERKLLTNSEKKKLQIRFNVDALLRGDAKSRAELYSSGIQNGWMKPNEARAFEELNKIEGGDQTFIQMNMVPLDQAGQQQPQEKEAEDGEAI